MSGDREVRPLLSCRERAPQQHLWSGHRDPEAGESQEGDLRAPERRKEHRDWRVICQAVEAGRIMGQKVNGPCP